MKTIGVLAVQGAFIEHIHTLNKLNVNCVEIREKSDLTNNKLDGIILPGGESTVIGKLIRELDIFNPLRQSILDGLPVLGTCAGLILLAKDIVNDENTYLGTMDIKVRRNAYGRQLGSFNTSGKFGSLNDVPMTFIRAPLIESVSENIEILSQVNNHIVAAKQDNMVVTSFHPELTDDIRIHNFFLDLIDKKHNI
ncbi:pyridoxal 5'-phosphate synthase glutaminase subunit PdxT [Serpentinicella alkaliphila]|uniref:Pyridoxal 5'-phosphate synthase subunit PdxT n=1 Tax=Serpentinicella alkaliphila TaxID=1734049 RepID=A0A4R2TY46_9FIRM|nr:pyridoxal 5'-phosphate synthase glutaminase subunit PdxT [Serpentinicella alkaliphila]QUH26786.1 pyridoxal 5'-phosphate synthase glutaminase subunit PdxT [Serpentinicella alkaliphila]TCQ08007.1 pyridoxal phosphate synthase yaaE subunit [Serpentinicella alkaliphila]